MSQKYNKDSSIGYEVMDIIMNVRLYGAKCSDYARYKYHEVVINNIDHFSYLDFTFL